MGSGGGKEANAASSAAPHERGGGAEEDAEDLHNRERAEAARADCAAMAAATASCQATGSETGRAMLSECTTRATTRSAML